MDRSEIGLNVTNRGTDDEDAMESLSSSDSTMSDGGHDDSEQVAGTWGERITGGPVRSQDAMQEYEVLRRRLTELSRTRSQASRVDTMSIHRSTHRAPSNAATAHSEKDSDKPSDDEAEFNLSEFIREGHLERRTDQGLSGKRLGVVFKHLTVKGTGNDTTTVRTLFDAVLGTFGPDLYRNIIRFVPGRLNQEPVRDIIRDFTGVVRHGEMMLVLGRPGSGCSTFLKALANNRKAYAAVEGEVSYSGISAKEQGQKYRGEVVYNPEYDIHLPTLTVLQTLRFSLLNKTRKHYRDDISTIIDALLRMFAMKHTKQTLVGDEFVRGISGGERKRVSIAEAVATKSSITCWDNSTRGLDASTALDFARSLRIMTDVSDRTTITTLYQAGEEIYQLMDKVLVIEEGRMIFQGPAGEAREYFIDLGFHAPERQTTADFLSSIGDAASREIREGYEQRCPQTTTDLEAAFRKSDHYQRMLAEVDDYEKHLARSDFEDAENLRISVQEAKSKTARNKSSYTVSFWKQTLACTKREFWLIWGDKSSLYTKYFNIVSVGLIVGSIFYQQPTTTSGAFSRGGTAIFSILFLGWLALTELIKAVSGRTVIARHHEYAMYRPSAVNLARVITDVPMILAQVIPFGIIMYFLSDLALEPAKFFIYILLIYVTTFNLTSLYRMFAALSPTIDDAVRFAGIAFNLFIIFTGYVIPKPQLISQKIWFGWIYYVNPVSYAFEAVLANEFSGRMMLCGPEMLVPQGPNVQPGHQGCAFAGAATDETVVSGDDYLQASFGYSYDNLWRNFAVLVAFTVLYILITMAATESLDFSQGSAGALVFKSKPQHPQKQPDEESGKSDGRSSDREKPRDDALPLAGSEQVFTWRNLNYSVPVTGGHRQLLTDVSGYAKPGVLVALVGASGAGKTTLLNTLAQRQTTGIVKGEMLVDGRALPADFERSTGFVEQMDIHDKTATVREAIEFSALLRQNHDTPAKEKISYVDEVIELLEMQEIENVIISSLSVEQTKRLTIAVELAAKPSLLLFLDEPTSGLDSQSALSIVRFLRKLSAAGQAIICTIHQPSAVLIEQFDLVLALTPGGHTTYFGPLGQEGSVVTKYFGERGAHCPPDKNVAEFILETITKGGRRTDWARQWKESAENKEVLAEIERIHESRSSAPTDKKAIRKFAAPVQTQALLLTKRMFKQQWRDPSYVYSRLFVSVVIGIFNGFTFWQLGDTATDLQNRMFTAFAIVLIPPTVVNAVVPKFFDDLSIWQAREHPSRTYNWVAFTTASIVTEVPASIVCATLYWVLWYWPAGLPTDSSTAGYVYLITVLFYIFIASWGQWICAFAPSFTVISNVLPFFFVVFGLFNGVIQPYSMLTPVWRSWLYWVNPSTYWIAGVTAATLPTVQVQCTPSESAHFTPPAGQTCGEYTSTFLRELQMGYIVDPAETTVCQYCPYTDGVNYLERLNVSPMDKWRDLGIFALFCLSNWALVYFFVWSVRVKGWSFGFRKITGSIKRLFRHGKGGDSEETSEA